MFVPEYDEVEEDCVVITVTATDDDGSELLIDVVDVDCVSLPSIMSVVLEAVL